ncbi:Prostatic Acid Phosphatase [Manis pentadactyla]|nr:Prostatic Acid Phosphatase [Manis pentadactyla]
MGESDAYPKNQSDLAHRIHTYRTEDTHVCYRAHKKALDPQRICLCCQSSLLPPFGSKTQNPVLQERGKYCMEIEKPLATSLARTPKIPRGISRLEA